MTPGSVTGDVPVERGEEDDVSVPEVPAAAPARSREDAVQEVVRLLPAIAALPPDARVDAYEKAARVLQERLDDVEA